MILYRPVGLQELELIYDSGMESFPTRLPQQPIFYPVLQLEYARQTASDWNAKNGQFAGYVTQFTVEDADAYASQFEKHTVGRPGGQSQYQELWIPAEELDEFNRHIVGHIKVLEAYFGDAFQGFVPEKFGMQGKNAVAQFTLLANSYLYKRMDFYLEIKRNHKAVFLNYPFWLQYDFKNQGLKKKILQTIREAWFTSFPKIPLLNPVQEDIAPVQQTGAQAHAQRLVDSVDEEVTPTEETGAQAESLVNPVDEQVTPAKLIEQTGAQAESLVNPVDEEVTSAKLIEQTGAQAESWAQPVHEETPLGSETDPPGHFAQGLELGLSGRYQEAMEELSRAVEEDPHDVIAHTSLGVAFHRLGEDDRALSGYEAALKIDPIHAEAHYFRANILYSRGNVRAAITGYTLALGLQPELIEAYEKPIPEDRLTDYSPSPAEMVWIAKPARRILDLNKSLETHPGEAHLFKERAAQYYRLRNYVQAIADYSSSLGIGPDDASVLHFRGLAYEGIGQLDRALEDYQRAIAINPQLSDVYIDRGVTFGKMGNLRQSLLSLTEGIRLAPENPDGYFNRGTSYFQLGDFESAIDDFSSVIQLSPGDEAAWYWRGISHEEAGRRQEAIADYRQYLAISQDPRPREEIEGKLSQWNEGERNGHGTARDGAEAPSGGRVSSRSAVPDEGQERIEVPSPAGAPDQDLDLYDLILALGERALHSTWFGSGVECYGENAEQLYAFTDQDRPIAGGDFLQITSGIRQTIAGDFQAFDPGAASHWIFIHAWEGSGFYIETNDPRIKERLKARFQGIEEVEGALPPYASLFIASDQSSR